jgi:hypothetical protein
MKYQIREDSGASEVIDANCLDEALTAAQRWASEGSYDERVTVSVYVHELDPETDEPFENWCYGDGRNAHGEAMAGPEPEPEITECGEDDEDHEWESPVELVGGCRENPGVFSSGTRFDYRMVCSKCGMYKHSWDVGSQRNPGENQEGHEYSSADSRSIDFFELR